MASHTNLNIILDFPVNEVCVQRLYFTEPIRIISAQKEEDIARCLDEIDRENEQGHYVVGFIAYDNAYTGYFVYFGVFQQAQLLPQHTRGATPELKGEWQLSESFSDFSKKISRIKEHIKNGDCYQINYTLRALNELHSGHPRDLYLDLTDHQAAKYSLYIEHPKFILLSFSPELFFVSDGTKIRTKPMKGTRPILTHQPLLEQMTALSLSEKDRAENVMIVDLLRNDLARVALQGSVKTTQLFAVEPYLDVLQMTSTIEADLPPDTSFNTLVDALFPCGSITGAPKKIVREILSTLEDTPRGPYCGAMGYVSPNKEALFNVAIRTMVHDTQTQQLIYGVGSGITWESKPEEEYQEIKDKLHFLTSQKPMALFETVYLHHGECWLWPKHFERLTLSAQRLGFATPTEDHFNSLRLCQRELKEVICRGKFTFHKNGIARWEFFPLPAVPANTNISLALSPVDSEDMRLSNKTTDRTPYDKALEEQDPTLFDVLLWNERGEVTEFSRGNLVIALDNQLYTPKLSAGLLPGILRSQLLEYGLIKERIIHKEELHEAQQLWFINSLRGWIPVTLIG